jgi:hypothetical protein
LTYAEILAAVIALTGREDDPAGTETMIQAATLRMHQSDFYARDISEALINLGSSSFAASFDAPGTFTRYRAVKYLRKYDLVTATKGKLLDKLEPETLFDAYGVEKTNVWYSAGNNIVFRSSTALQYLYAGWYSSPIISPVANFASWIADTVPHAIIFDACSLIFQTVNQQEQSRKYDGLVQEQLAMVKMHGLEGKGY